MAPVARPRLGSGLRRRLGHRRHRQRGWQTLLWAVVAQGGWCVARHAENSFRTFCSFQAWSVPIFLINTLLPFSSCNAVMLHGMQGVVY